MVILKENSGILKWGGGIKMWMWVCVELFRIWELSQNEEEMLGSKKRC